jgi:hypothetical protein
VQKKIDHFTSEDTRDELGNCPTNRNIEENTWREHLDRMSEGRILKQILTYSLKGNR